ncbi:DNA-binding MarR family transcriptional regulator [Pseudomonas duriflava]|uniref:DNA-binding MarR family transcriptional regulator n=1 Tax=Pseudomonas duriflava TaxID=459528 RepID=A0A562Q6A3_9PSED|nr:MarR family transcriptional regulator [Pseudomonas duriflava]TWI52291.1 DNA-binding MarR family transcriptional regulator [Pseudomonas duriflava]
MPHFNHDDFPLYQSVGHLIHLTNALKDRLLDKHLESHGITSAQFKVLLLLSRDDVNTPVGLCRCLSLDSGAMTRMLDRLEGKYLITRVRSTTDRRQVRLELTEQGRSLSQLIPQIAADALNDLTGALSSTELREFERLLRKVLTPAGLLPPIPGE